MKIIITESQYKTLLESKTDSMQELINMAFEQVKENCEGGYYIRSHEHRICDPVDMIEEIKVVDVSKSLAKGHLEKKETEILNITIDCYIDSIHEYNNIYNFIHELQEEVRNILGVKFIIIHLNEVINKTKDFNW